MISVPRISTVPPAPRPDDASWPAFERFGIGPVVDLSRDVLVAVRAADRIKPGWELNDTDGPYTCGRDR